VRIGLIAAALIALACPALAGENHTTFYSEEIKFAPNNAFPRVPRRLFFLRRREAGPLHHPGQAAAKLQDAYSYAPRASRPSYSEGQDGRWLRHDL